MRWIFKLRGIALGHAALNVDGTSDRIDDAGKLQQQSIAGGFYNSAAVLGDLRVNEFAAVGLQSREGGTVVAAHEEGIAHHIG